ncbi:hypothetical protein D3C73_953910 [compost metagenome]
MCFSFSEYPYAVAIGPYPQISIIVAMQCQYVIARQFIMCFIKSCCSLRQGIIHDKSCPIGTYPHMVTLVLFQGTYKIAGQLDSIYSAIIPFIFLYNASAFLNDIDAATVGPYPNISFKITF